MRILALDSSGLVASVAVLEDDIMLAEYTVNYKKTHSQTLLPMLDAIVTMLELDMDQIDAIAVAAGPGSFTGLRIGSATAKGLGLALNKPLVPVPTVDALAYNLYQTDHLICPIMDARRGQVYTGIYCYELQKLTIVMEQTPMDVTDLVRKLNELGRGVIFLGDAVPVYGDIIAEQIQVDYAFAPPHLSRQRAGAIGALGQIYYQEGKYESAAMHCPNYLRMTQAERERAERKKEQES